MKLVFPLAKKYPLLFLILLIALIGIEQLPSTNRNPVVGPPDERNDINSLGSENSTLPLPSKDPAASKQPEMVEVKRVIDGDTIELTTGQTVRYIGVNSPETGDRDQCYSQEALEKNKQLVAGKIVRLEKDVSELDKYKRLLRYVWVGDMLVNEYLVREGFAKASAYPPDTKYQKRFSEAQRKAKSESLGLWGLMCNKPVAN